MAGRLAEFLGLRRNVALLLAATVLIGAGEELWMRFLPKYLEALGAAVFVIGLFDLIKTLLGALYAYPGGVIVDRWGIRGGLVVFTLASLAGYGMLFGVRSTAGVMVGMFLFLAWSNLSLPAVFSLIAADLPAAKLSMGIGIQSLVKRVPIIVGPLAGGMLIDRYGLLDGVPLGAAVALGCGVLALAAVGAMRNAPAGKTAAGGAGLAATLGGFPPALRQLLLSDILVRFCERLPAAWIVIYAMNEVGVSAAGIGVLTAVEMGVAIACYVPSAHLADRYGKEPFVVATFVFFTLFPAALAVADGFPMLLLAFAIRGLKEFGDPARKALIVSYAPPERRGQVVGAYYLVRDSVVSLGALAGAALWALGPQVNFWASFATGALGCVVYMRSRTRQGILT